MSGQRDDYEILATQLYDALLKHPDGMSIGEISRSLGVGVRIAPLVIRKLRLLLGGGDSINVPFRVEGRKYLYYLAGQPSDGAQWQAIRAKTMLSRIEVDSAWWNSMVAATDGRTAAGRIARAAARQFSRLAEDVREIAAPDVELVAA